MMNAITQVDKITEPVKFTDKKRKLWLLGLVVPNIANATFLGYQFGLKLLRNYLLIWALWHYISSFQPLINIWEKTRKIRLKKL